MNNSYVLLAVLKVGVLEDFPHFKWLFKQNKLDVEDVRVFFDEDGFLPRKMQTILLNEKGERINVKEIASGGKTPVVFYDGMRAWDCSYEQ